MGEIHLFGLSACLAGQRVRYDGGDKANPGLLAWRGAGVEFTLFCPEAQAGLSIPREAMRLESDGARTRVVGCVTGRDYAPALRPWCVERAKSLAAQGVLGVVLKSNSPSCAGTHPAADAVDGLLAAALAEVAPLIPVTHEKALADAEGRTDFVSRAWVLKRWRELKGRGVGRPELVRFQTIHKLELMAHSHSGCTALGRIAAAPAVRGEAERASAYEKGLLECLASRATAGRHVNALSHCAGYLRGRVGEEERENLHRAIQSYGEGRVALTEPLALLARLVAGATIPYLAAQTYLNPNPVQLALMAADLTWART